MVAREQTIEALRAALERAGVEFSGKFAAA
jgi:hypothetical protein